ncbi:MAG: hypothetical protein OXF56_25470 [Rhodobacteraceae bacterium]|nr:hypothetical protein [Paracoccaceae bacterium]
MKLEGRLFEFPEILDREPIDTHGNRGPVMSFSRVLPSWANGWETASTIPQFA